VFGVHTDLFAKKTAMMSDDAASVKAAWEKVAFEREQWCVSRVAWRKLTPAHMRARWAGMIRS